MCVSMREKSSCSAYIIQVIAFLMFPAPCSITKLFLLLKPDNDCIASLSKLFRFVKVKREAAVLTNLLDLFTGLAFCTFTEKRYPPIIPI